MAAGAIASAGMKAAGRWLSQLLTYLIVSHLASKGLEALGSYLTGKKEIALKEKELTGQITGQQMALQEKKELSESDFRRALTLRGEDRAMLMAERQAQRESEQRALQAQMLAMVLASQNQRAAQYAPRIGEPISLTQLLGHV